MFDWTDYLELARQLGGRQDEASLRSAISRAYYAAYCTARNRLLQQGAIIPNGRDVHGWVWQQYVNASEHHLRSVGNDGDRLRQWRNKADYDDQFPKLADYVHTAITKATKLLGSL